jgi:hypothetical protein
MTRLLIIGAILAIFLAPLSAHHSFAAEFDFRKQVRITGTVTRLEWTNPHAWIHMNVMSPDGRVTEWTIESGTPNILSRAGFTRASLKPGTGIVVEGYQAKNGSANAKARDIALPDGRKLFLGSSGTGAPYDEKNPEALPINR